MPWKLTTEQFVERAKRIHPEYDYSLVKYIDTDTNVEIVCPVHGKFEITPHHFLGGRICPKCNKSGKVYDTQSFVEKSKKIFGDRYDYSEVDYKDSREKVKIICPKHGPFLQRASSHTSGNGCPACDRENTKRNFRTQDEFIKNCKKVHGDKYDYSNVNYRHSQEKVELVCPIHGSFFARPSDILSGTGCPACQESRLETITRNFLDSNHIDYCPQKHFDWLVYEGPQRIDFYLPQHKIGIECQGEQHFFPVSFSDEQDKYDAFRETQKRDQNKYILCKEHDIKLLYFTKVSKKLFHTVPYHCITEFNELLAKIKGESYEG